MYLSFLCQFFFFFFFFILGVLYYVLSLLCSFQSLLGGLLFNWSQSQNLDLKSSVHLSAWRINRLRLCWIDLTWSIAWTDWLNWVCNAFAVAHSHVASAGGRGSRRPCCLHSWPKLSNWLYISLLSSWPKSADLFMSSHLSCSVR